MYNVGQAGLTFWAPNINIFRDPRWGRGQETPGEDPMVASAFAIEFVRGFQRENSKFGGGNEDRIGGKRVLSDDGDGSNGLMLSACCKHFTAYDLEKWEKYSRYNFNAVVRFSPTFLVNLFPFYDNLNLGSLIVIPSVKNV